MLPPENKDYLMPHSAPRPIHVTVWNEFVHEKSKPEVARHYPAGIHRTIADALIRQFDGQIVVRTATLEEPEHGLTPGVLASTDVLFWWGHAAHDRVADAVVERVQKRVLEGMGLVALHSGHASKIFGRLMGTGCMLRWRDVGERERLWIVNPAHPLVDGLKGEYFELPQSEMYGEPFDIPQPDDLVLVSWFAGGEVFRSGCTFRRGKGKIVYFSPGHETFPIYHDPTVQRVLANAARWSVPTGTTYHGDGRHIPEPLNKIE
jgi:trehalose utilization protein